MTVKELAIKYYPKLWDINRLKKLVEAGKLTKADFEEITGENGGLNMTGEVVSDGLS